MTTLVATRLGVAAGDGLLARRADGVLFVGRSVEGAGDAWQRPVDGFVHAADTTEAVQAVLDHAVDHHLEVGPFVIVTWAATVHLVVFGDLTIVSDLPSVPRLSGSGMPTWVEHRATRVPERAALRLGDEPAAGTDLLAGIVPAGGFQLTLAGSAAQPAGATAAATPVASAPPTAPAPVAAAPPEARPATAPNRTTPVAPPAPELVWGGEPAPPAQVPATSSWDILRDAGGAWMDDSLQLSEPRHAPPAAPPPTAPAAPEIEAPTNAFDPEVTLDAKTFTTAAPDEAPPEPAPLARFVQARRCDLGHLNPPLRTRCSTCDHYVPPATPIESVPQPVLATLVLADGRTVDVAGPVVLGRIPSPEAARLDEPGVLVTLAEPTVSRTHAVVTVDGWTLLAVDCGTTGGTAIAPAGRDPSVLEPWVPHELAPGDTLYLGGPTKITVVARS